MTLRWTEERFAEHLRNKLTKPIETIPLRPPKKSKYGNTKTAVDGKTFDSKAEAERYTQLCMMQRAGLIADLKCQVSFDLVDACVICGKKRRAMRYEADFTYMQDGALVVEDVKGMKATRVFSMKQHLMKDRHGIDVREYRKD